MVKRCFCKLLTRREFIVKNFRSRYLGGNREGFEGENMSTILHPTSQASSLRDYEEAGSVGVVAAIFLICSRVSAP
jgi:hypothetical protein